MNEVMTVIKAIHTDRSPAAKRRVTDAALGIQLDAARWAPTAHNMQNFEIMVVDDPAALVSLGSIRREFFAAFLRETYRQLSFSEEELRHKKTGVLARMFPPSWRRPDATAASMEPSVRVRSNVAAAQSICSPFRIMRAMSRQVRARS